MIVAETINWVRFIDQEPPLYTSLLVESDAGFVTTQYMGDNEWNDGSVANVYFWAIALKGGSPTPSLREHLNKEIIKSWPIGLAKSPQDLADRFARLAEYIAGGPSCDTVSYRLLKGAYLAGHKAGYLAGFGGYMIDFKVKWPIEWPLNDNGTSQFLPSEEQATPEDYVLWEEILEQKRNLGKNSTERAAVYEALQLVPRWYKESKS